MTRLRRWLAPGGLEVKRVDVDERVGGHYRVWQADSGADVGGFDCELLELVPDQRIVFRWGFVGPDRDDGPAYDSLPTITLREAPGVSRRSPSSTSGWKNSPRRCRMWPRTWRRAGSSFSRS